MKQYIHKILASVLVATIVLSIISPERFVAASIMESENEESWNSDKTDFLVRVDNSENGSAQLHIEGLNKEKVKNINKVRAEVWVNSVQSKVITYETRVVTNEEWVVDIKASELGVEEGQVTIRPFVYLNNTQKDAENSKSDSELQRIISQEELEFEKNSMNNNEDKENKVQLDDIQTMISYQQNVNDDNFLDSSEDNGVNENTTTNDLLEPDTNGEQRITNVSSELNIEIAEDQKSVMIRTGHMPENMNIQQVKFGIWSDINGQDDLRWYVPEQANGVFEQRVKIEDFLNPGNFTVHCYLINSDNVVEFVSGNKFQISAPSMTAVSFGEVNTDTGAFSVNLKGITSKSGIKTVKTGIWCDENQDDIFWYEAKEKEGQYVVSGNVFNHRMHSGVYKVHVYVEDGNGFTTFVGGTTANIKSYQSKIYIQNVDGVQKQYKASIGMFSGVENASQVKFAVWSDEGGQDDLIWYNVAQLNGIYAQTIDIKDYKSTGSYTVHCYAANKNGVLTYISGEKFYINKPTIENVSAVETKNGFSITMKNLSSPSGINRVDVAVWSSSDSSDLRWYAADKTTNGYTVDALLKNHKNNLGLYQIHIYATDGNGIKSFSGGMTKSIGFSCDKLSVAATNNEGMFGIQLDGLHSYGLAEKLQFAVWSKNNGQNDLTWYQGAAVGNSYRAEFNVKSHDGGGAYYIHAYAFDASGKMYYVDGTTITINGTVSVGKAADGKISVKIENLDPEVGLTSILVPVWTKDDQSDCKWYSAIKSSDGSYSATIDMKDFGYYLGYYNIHVYAVLNAEQKKLIAITGTDIDIQRGTFQKITASSNKMTYTVNLEKADLLGIAKNVKFGVWSEINGQDDFKWYEAEKSAEGYKIIIPIKDYITTGTYLVHAYYELPDGQSHFLNATDFQVDSIPIGGIEFTNINGKTGTFDITAQLGSIGFDAKKVKVGVWCESGTYWYDMQSLNKDTFKASADVKNNGYQFGTYNAHVYAEDANGNLKYVVGKSFVLNADNYLLTEKPSNDTCKITIFGPNVNGQAVTDVKFPTWNLENGQNIIWFSGQKLGNGGYSITIKRDSFQKSGEFATHIYGYVGGVPYIMAASSYSLYRMGEFDDYAKQVMHNIIYAVETGGQIYGNARFDDFTQAYNNSVKETAITIGAGQWFATEAQRLLKLIRTADPKLFASLDTAGIGVDLDTANWKTYGGDGNGKATILKGSPKALCIQKIISTDVGISVQNRLVDEQMTTYVQEAEKLGVIDLKAKMFCANIRHLGGYSSMKWVIECCIGDNKTLTMQNIWTSMRDHTPDKAGNGVGADKYKTRHEKVMGWLDKYID